MTLNVSMLLFFIYLNNSDIVFKIEMTLSPIMHPGEQVVLPWPQGLLAMITPRNVSPGWGHTGETELGTGADGGGILRSGRPPAQCQLAPQVSQARSARNTELLFLHTGGCDLGSFHHTVHACTRRHSSARASLRCRLRGRYKCKRLSWDRIPGNTGGEKRRRGSPCRLCLSTGHVAGRGGCTPPGPSGRRSTLRGIYPATPI